MTIKRRPLPKDLVADDELAPHHVLVKVDDGAGIRLAKDLEVDGKRFLIPSEATVDVKVGANEPLQVTLTIFADTVEFQDVGVNG